MPARSQEYTLVGFSTDLDWKPLHFVKPLPLNRICSACGLLRPKTAMFPCAHTLCEVCYEQCAHKDTRVCPLDEYECHNEDDVVWRVFDAEDLLRREVKCWNEGRSCQHVAPASRIMQHFQRECGHHSVFSPRCSAAVPCSNVVTHLKSSLCIALTPVTSEYKGKSLFKNLTTLVSSFEAIFATNFARINNSMTLIALAIVLIAVITTHLHGLNALSSTINAVKATATEKGTFKREHVHPSLMRVPDEDEMSWSQENVGQTLTTINTLTFLTGINKIEKSLKSELAKIASQTHDLSRIVSAIEEVKAVANENNHQKLIEKLDALYDSRIMSRLDQKAKDGFPVTAYVAIIAVTLTFVTALIVNNKNSENALTCIENFLRHGELGPAHCMFSVKNVTSLRDAAFKNGLASDTSEKVYLRGYYISPGVTITRSNEVIKLHPMLQLHKGDMDDLVQWPFQHRVRLSVMHSTEDTTRVLVLTPVISQKYYQKPTSPSNTAVYDVSVSLDVSALIGEGYVDSDRFRLKWELLPRLSPVKRNID